MEEKQKALPLEGAEEVALQEHFMELLARHPKAPRRFYINTMGCQMNARDSEKLRGILRAIGASESPEEEADLVIYNTCCVRENAEQKVFGRLGYLKSIKRSRPHMKIALCGCMMQEKTVLEKLRASYKEVDLIFGTFNLYKFPELLYAVLDSDGPIIDIWQSHQEIVEDLPSIRKFPFKASVNIMYGCDNFCTYCIVPYVRGRERSREKEPILQEIKALVADGVKEIQLLGQNVNSYGKGLAAPLSFAQLLREIAKIEGLERIRFMTSHPKDLSDELIAVMQEEPKLCPHFHLPLQSGSDRLLKLMNRHYTKARYLEIAKKLREAVPDIAITTDIIVGFPTESREDFLETLEVVREVGFEGAFTFRYSPREGTAAALMEQVDAEEVSRNFRELLELIDEVAGKKAAAYEGKVVEVLAEDINRSDPSMLTGRSSQNMLVHFTAPRERIGQIVPVEILKSSPYYLIGKERNDIN